MNKKKFKLPHIYVLLVGIIIFCAILTWIVPAGQFDRELNADGIEVAVAWTYHKVESPPIGPFKTVQAIYKGMNYNITGTEIIKDVMRENNIAFETSDKAEGSSDIGNVSFRCPAIHPSIAITEEWVPLHTEKMTNLVKLEKSKDAIVNGAKIILGFFDKLLDEPSLLEQIVQEFKSS